MKNEQWRYSGKDAVVISAKGCIEQTPDGELSPQRSAHLKTYIEAFGNMEFTRFLTRGLPYPVLQGSYHKEETSFLKQVRKVHFSQITKGEILQRVTRCIKS